jgi:hypothetical protein
VAIVALFLLLEGGRAVSSISGEPTQFLSEQSDEDADDTKPVQQEREAPDESESESKSESETDDTDETTELGHSGLEAGVTFNVHSGKLLFGQLRLAVEGRARISLIILHHCWKSFPD